jgi:hypothetical protein
MSEIFAKIIAGIMLIFVIALLMSLPVMWLWNGTLPELFGAKTINWFMALKVSFLSSMLFKSSNSSSSKD